MDASSLLSAIANHDIRSFELCLVSGVNVSVLDKSVPGGLVQSALRSKGVSRMHMVALLARAGARVDIHNDFGIPPLFEVLTSTLDNNSHRQRALLSLLGAGADPNEYVHEEVIEYDKSSMVPLPVVSGMTSALGIAAQVGDVSSMDALLSAGANPNAPRSMVSPLRMSMKYKQHACAALLLVAGADLSHVDGEGWPASAFIRDQESLSLLEAAGLDIKRSVGPHGESLLQSWCRHAPDDMLLRLLAARDQEQIWRPDTRGEHAIGKLWARFGRSKEEWIPRLVAEWEEDRMLSSSGPASGRSRSSRL